MQYIKADNINHAEKNTADDKNIRDHNDTADVSQHNRQMKIARKIMKKYDSALQKLAKL